MSHKPFMPFYTEDYLRDTSRLTTEEHGAYLLLLINYWRTEKPLPADPRILRSITFLAPKRFQKVFSQIEVYFDKIGAKNGSVYVHKRMEKIIAEYRAKVDKKRQSGKLGAEIKKKKWQANALANGKAYAKANGKAYAKANGIAISDIRLQKEEEDKNTVNLSNDKFISGKPEQASFFSPPQKPKNPKNEELKKQACEVLEFLNQLTGKSYRPCETNLKLIVARLKSGATGDQCRQVIVKKRRDWIGDSKMAPYLRPATLFNATKFEQYLGELPKAQYLEDELLDDGGNENV